MNMQRMYAWNPLFVPALVSHPMIGKRLAQMKYREIYPMVFCANKYIPCITTPHDVTSS
jgi:hypothetical protein